jgi:hypothetical protein
MACEDYPCCGHEPGDCPTLDSQGRARWTCVECGKRLSLKAASSICTTCQRRRARSYDYGDGLDHDYGMNG